MNKNIKIILGFISIALMLTGCGQNSTVDTASSQPEGIKIKGIVREVTLGGTVGGAVAGAVVSLAGDSVNKTVTVNSAGEYLIEGIPDGYYNIIITAEGYIRGRVTGLVIKPGSYISADNTITIQDVLLNSSPIISAVSPTPNSIIASNQAITVTFDEPMDPTTVRFNLNPIGLRAYALLPASTGRATTTWDSTGRIATVTPTTNLNMNTVYRLVVSPDAKDLKGYPLVYSGSDESLALTQEFRVVSGGVPGAPSGVAVTVNGRTDEAFNFWDVANPANGVALNWQPPALTNITGYKVYVAKDGANYVYLGAVADNMASFTVQNIIDAIFGSGTTANPISRRDFPFVNYSVSFKVVAYNGDGETAVVTTALRDKIGPSMSNSWATMADVITDQGVFVPGITAADNSVYIQFNEPIDHSTLIKDNFTFSGGLTVVSVDFIYTECRNYVTYCRIKANGAVSGSGQSLTATSGVKDLSGNSVKSTANTQGPF